MQVEGGGLREGWACLFLLVKHTLTQNMVSLGLGAVPDPLSSPYMHTYDHASPDSHGKRIYVPDCKCMQDAS
jgi:hypothetical protein